MDMTDNREATMYTDVVHVRPQRRFKLVPSLEAVCLFCAIGLALAAIIIPMLPREALEWALAHLG
jgi:hypothetical protein